MTVRHGNGLLLILIALLGCNGQSPVEASLVGSCADASGASLLPPRDGGLPACIGPNGSECPAPPETDGAPDPDHWGCYVDEDCAVFPARPICDRGRCSATQQEVTCVAGDSQVNGLPSPEVAHVFSGSNGTFADRCDEHGNLVAFQCEAVPPPCDRTSGIPNPCPTFLVFTGKVIPNQDSATIDCDGQCRDGRCNGRCPQQADEVTLLGRDADGNPIIRNATDGRVYACQSSGEAQCGPGPTIRAGYIAALGLNTSDGFCTGKTIGGIGVKFDDLPPADCLYSSCRIVPPNCSR